MTSDRGSAWDTVRTAFPGWEAYAPWAFGMRFADSLFGWASIRLTLSDSNPDWRWLVSRTTDGGFTWRIVFADTAPNRHINPSVMWAGDSLQVMLGTSALVLRSVDEGVTWKRDSLQSYGPQYSPLHPAGAWPVFGVGLAFNKLLHYGVPPATTGVERPDENRAGPVSDGKVRIVELHVDASHARLRIASGTTSAISVRLFDLTGRLLYRADRDDDVTGEQTIEVPAERLPAGLYAVWIVTADGVDGRLVPILKR